jgi:hypothetical protein
MDRLRRRLCRDWPGGSLMRLLQMAGLLLCLAMILPATHSEEIDLIEPVAPLPIEPPVPEPEILDFSGESLSSWLGQGRCEIPCRVLDPLDQCPLWTGRAESLLLWRGGPQSAPLFATATAAGSPGTVALNAADLASGMAAGPRFSLFRHTGDTGQIEATYFNVDAFRAAATLPDTAGGYVLAPGLLCCAPETRLDRGSAMLSSSIQSLEINRRLPTAGRWQWLAGFRWVQWNEDFGMDAATSLGPDLSIRNDVNNDLYGLQIGADTFLFGTGGPFWIEGIGKAGVYYNRSAQFTSFALDGGQPLVAAGGTSTSRAAFVGELGATAVWQVNDWLAVRAGYLALWLGGIAQSTNQLDQQCLICADKPPTQATDTGGSVFVNGITLGLEVRW